MQFVEGPAMARRTGGARGATKVTEWRARLARHAGSGLSITRFCEAEGVSMPSFFNWRRRLAGAGGARPIGEAVGAARNAGDTGQALFQPILIEASGRRDVSIRLANGARLRLPAENVALVCAVVAALAGATRAAEEAP
jgi:hypothetical protein